ncbi:DNA-binding transcription factor [Coemansia sp. RSA 1933]|nr:DNA-binding transcription factor [Coemansia sp. RSA 1933]
MSTVAPSIPESLVVSARIRRGRPKLSEQKDISKSEQALLDEGYRQIIDQIAHDASEDSGGRRRQFVCTVPGCGKVFFQRAHLNIHIRSHTGYKPYACPYPGCGKSFPQRGNMRTHERTHTGDRPFKCSVAACQRAFTQRGNLKTHLKKVHGIAGGDSGVSSPSGGIQKSTSSRNKQAFSPSAILSATNASFVNSIGSSGSG